VGGVNRSAEEQLPVETGQNSAYPFQQQSHQAAGSAAFIVSFALLHIHFVSVTKP
jgi:hypothetical protein